MQMAQGHRPVPQCSQNWRKSGFLSGRSLPRNIGFQNRCCQKVVTCKQRGQRDDDAPISPPTSFQNLFGGTRKIKADAKQQAPTQGTRPGKGTQKLKLGRSPFSGGKADKGGGTRATGTSFLRSARKDPNTVFVAGATGRLGARIVKMLLEKNNQIKVRAGVRDIAKAAEYLQTATSFGLLPGDASRRVQLVQVDITDPDSIGPAIGSASKVVQAIGAPESEALNFSNPKKIDGDGAIALVDAAVAAGIDQYVMVTSLGTAKIGFPAAVLNLFGGILIQKRRAEVALENSGLNYVIVRPGGMERPTDSYKDTHNVRLSPADTLFGGQVSRWQVAELVAAAVGNPSVVENKILEVVAEETAPLRSYEELLSAAPSDISQADKVAKKSAEREAAKQLEEARQKVAQAQEAAQEAKELVQEQTALANEIRRQAEEARSEAGPLKLQVEQNEQQLKKLRAEAQQSQRKENAAKAVLAAAKDASREGRALSKDERSALERPILYPEEAQQQPAAPSAAQQKPRPAATKPKVPPMPVQARTQEEAVAKAKEAYSAQPKASAKTGRSFFERLKPEKASAPAQAPVAAKTKEEAIARSKNVSSQQQAPQTDRKPAPPKKTAAPMDANELQRRREAAAKAAAESRSIEERVLRAAEEEREKKAAAARAKRREEDQKRQEAEAKQRREIEARIRAEMEATTKRRAQAYDNRPRFTPLPEAKSAEKLKSAEKPKTAEKAPRGKNADEARVWIAAWKKGPKGPMQPMSEAGTGKPASSAESNGASKELKSEGVGKAQSGKSEEVPDNVREAREWIRSWRASKLEASLPEDVKANSK